jgi:hypothetical protein
MPATPQTDTAAISRVKTVTVATVVERRGAGWMPQGFRVGTTGNKDMVNSLSDSSYRPFE